MILYLYKIYPPNKLSILTQSSLGSNSQLTFQADTWVDTMCMRLTWIPSPVPRTENEYVSSQRFMTTMQLVIESQKRSEIAFAVVCREGFTMFCLFCAPSFCTFLGRWETLQDVVVEQM